MNGDRPRTDIDEKISIVGQQAAPRVSSSAFVRVMCKQDAQLSQRDRAAGCISFGQK